MTRLSATTIKEYRRCNRRYFWARVEKIPTPTSPQQALGTEVHAVLEAHVLGRPTYTFSPVAEGIARPAFNLLAFPRSRVEVEKRFEIQVEGVTLSGVIDLAYVDPDGHAHGLDFKTTSDWKWMLSAEEAAVDPQTVIYATVIRDELMRRPIGSFRYLYLHKQRPAARELHADLSSLDRSWERLVQDVVEIDQNTDKDPRAWRANTNACGDYGGCPFKSQCGRLGDGPMGFLGKLGAPAPAPATTNPTVPTSEAKTVEPKPYPVPPQSEADIERGRLVDKLVAAGRVRAEVERRNLVELTILAKQLEDPINPPDGTPREAQVAVPKKEQAQATTLPNGTVVDKAKLDELLAFFASKADVIEQRVDGARKALNYGVQDLREDAVRLIHGGASKILEAITDGVGANKVSKPKAKTEPAENLPQMPDPQPLAQSVAAPDPKVTTPEAAKLLATFTPAPTPSLTIFVNCAPVRGGEIMTLDELVASIVRDVERAVGNDAFYGAIDYGKGPALVAAGLQRALDDGEISLPTELSVDLRERYAPDCLSVLRRMYPQSREFRGYV